MRVSRERLAAMERVRRVERGEAPPDFAPRKMLVVPSPKKRKQPLHAVPLTNGVHSACLNCEAPVHRTRMFCRPCRASFPADIDVSQRTRWFVVQAYGGQCACCGEQRFHFLAIDHVNGGGSAHRRAIGNSGRSLSAWLARHRLPRGYRILCHNCNLARGFYGACPHESERAAGERSAG